MNRVMALLSVAVGVMILCSTGAVAATAHEAIGDMLRTDIAVKKTEVMSRAMLLPRAESEAFWPVYRKYEREREQLEGRALDLLADYMKSYQTLDDAEAQALLDRLFELHEQRLVLLRGYATELQAKLPTRKVAGFVLTEFDLLRLLDLHRTANLGLIR